MRKLSKRYRCIVLKRRYCHWEVRMPYAIMVAFLNQQRLFYKEVMMFWWNTHLEPLSQTIRMYIYRLSFNLSIFKPLFILCRPQADLKVCCWHVFAVDAFVLTLQCLSSHCIFGETMREFLLAQCSHGKKRRWNHGPEPRRKKKKTGETIHTKWDFRHWRTCLSSSEEIDSGCVEITYLKLKADEECAGWRVTHVGIRRTLEISKASAHFSKHK